MYKGRIITDTTATANTNVPFAVARNTNANTRYDSTNNEVDIFATGYYDTLATIVATSTAGGTISAQLYADGQAVDGAVSTVVLDATGTGTFVIYDNVDVVPAYANSFASLSIRFSADVTVNDAIWVVKKTR